MNISEANIITTPSKKSKWRIIIATIGAIIFIWAAIYFFPVHQAEHSFFKNDQPLVIAHQGGEHLAPSNTLTAFKNAKKLGVDVIEFDIHMTVDGHLVAIHDNTVDRTTNGEGKVNELPLETVQSLDAGHYFKDLDGEYSFQDQGIYIPTVEEIFETIQQMKWNIEIKATNDPKLYHTISTKLWDLIQEYNLVEDVLIVSFDQDIIDIVNDISHGEALVAGGRQEITKFVIFHKLFLNSLYRPTVDAMQIPINEGNINLQDKKIIHGANRRGMDVHYWTINDKQTMKKLLDLGADGILTDRPDLLINLLNSK